MFLRIPNHIVIDFDFPKFCDHVLDHSPAFATRSLLRLGMKARDAIAAAVNDVAEIPDEAAELWQRACAEAPVPRLELQQFDAARKPLGEPQPIPARAYEPFYAAVEGMARERPVVAEALPVAAE